MSDIINLLTNLHIAQTYSMQKRLLQVPSILIPAKFACAYCISSIVIQNFLKIHKKYGQSLVFPLPYRYDTDTYP